MDPVKIVTNSMAPLHQNHRKEETRESTFGDTLRSLVLHVDEELKKADQMTAEFAVGKRQNLHEIMIASEKAGISFKFLLEVRNKLLDAYRQIMSMSF
jgi:flagellar hook-basal body complex protein FliE